MHDIAFTLGPLTVHWYGILVAIGFLAGLWTSSRRAASAGIPGETVYDLGPWLVVGGLLGGRILYIFSYWSEFFDSSGHWIRLPGSKLPEIFMVNHGGLIFYGGLIGAVTLGTGWILRKKLSLMKMADILAPGICLGYFFGRFGCLMHGCCYGSYCSWPWAVVYPPGHETHPEGSPGMPVHPTQIYDSLLNLAFYFFLARLFRHRKFDGQVFAAYLTGYAVIRAFVELFRGDYPKHYLGGVATPAQLISIGILAAGLTLLFLLPRRLSPSVAIEPAKPTPAIAPAN
jgi:phosphatidylglycerol:prolipoprotein diacylglycerol transferase